MGPDRAEAEPSGEAGEDKARGLSEHALPSQHVTDADWCQLLRSRVAAR